MKRETEFHGFARAMMDLPVLFDRESPLPAALKMASDGRHEIYYAPFDHMNEKARVVLVGITPGRVQAIEAISTARRCLASGMDELAAAGQAKTAASFAGPMRSNLVHMLDHVGLARRLRLPSTADFWTTRPDLVHFTSVFRYPVFKGGKNFSGSGTIRGLLLEQLEKFFATECAMLPHALFVPLGSAVEAACTHMARTGRLRDAQILKGLPHPSGANAERIAYFLGRKPRERLSAKTKPESLDAGRDFARKIVQKWAP